MRAILIAAIAFAAACGDDVTTKDDLRKSVAGRPEGCRACAADEICRQSFDGVCPHSAPGVGCVKVSPACKAAATAADVPLGTDFTNGCPSDCEDELCGRSRGCRGMIEWCTGMMTPGVDVYCWGV